MLRTLVVLVIGLGLGAGAVIGNTLLQKPVRVEEKEVPVVIEQIREVAKLESLSVLTFKKVHYEPDDPPAESTLGELAKWASKSVYPRRGRAILFGDAHYALDLQKLDQGSVRAKGKHVDLVLPPVVTHLELRTGDTEVIESSLTPEQFAKMLEDGRKQMELEVARDPVLKSRAVKSAERALRAFLISSGFESVTFVDALPAPAGTG